MFTKQIYLDFKEDFLFISKLTHNKNIFTFQNPQKIISNNFEFKDDRLFNISSIMLKIKSYLASNNIKRASLIICIPKLDQKEDLFQKLITFQLTLCIKKIDLKIEKIIAKTLLNLKEHEEMPQENFFTKNQLDNQLDFFKKFKQLDSSNPTRWLIFFTVLFVTLTITFSLIQKNQRIKLETIKKQTNILEKENDSLQKNLIAINQLKQKNSILFQKIKKLKTGTEKTTKIQEVLLSISQTIPEKSRLIKISFEKNKKSKTSSSELKNSNIPKNFNKEKICLVELEGITSGEEEILDFMNKLSKKSILKSLKLTSIQKTKKGPATKKHTLSYNFKIKAQIS